MAATLPTVPNEGNLGLPILPVSAHRLRRAEWVNFVHDDHDALFEERQRVEGLAVALRTALDCDLDVSSVQRPG